MGKKSGDSVTLHFCIKERSGKRECCAGAGANELRKYAKSRIEAIDGKAKVKKVGCLGYCSSGPVVEVQPGNVFYRYRSQSDIDEILAAHLDDDGIVKRLLIGRKKS